MRFETPYKKYNILLIITFIIISSFIPRLLFAEISTNNTSRYVGNGRWDWSIFLVGDKKEIEGIKCVEYTLHKSFKNPVQLICDSSKNNFTLKSNGWGTFDVKVKITFKNGSAKDISHRLKFTDKNKEAGQNRFIVKNWSKELEPGWWEWGVYLTGKDGTVLNDVKCVEYTLHKSFPNPIRTICDRSKKFEMKTKGWGEFKIPVKVILKDGYIVKLSYKLTLSKSD